jgi:membrane protein YdbS with pleckstrin-like domain
MRPPSDVEAAPVLLRDDARRVRLYFRLAALVSSLFRLLLALVLIWLLRAFVDESWVGDATIAILSLAVVIGVASIALTELRSRSYDVTLTTDAVTFEYGRKRSYVPRQHIQLFDIESSLLLRRFGLRRCNLHTAGGTVVVSPVPATIAAAIERLIGEQLAQAQPGQPNAAA